MSRISLVCYCERAYYLRQVMCVEDIDSRMAQGVVSHSDLDVRSWSHISGKKVLIKPFLSSHLLGLSGYGDFLEFNSDGLIYPVERKVGKTLHEWWCVQVVAEVMACEELLDRDIEYGVLQLLGSRKREFVRADTNMRRLTTEAALRMHAIVESSIPVTEGRKGSCRGCSLFSVCQNDISFSLKYWHDILLEEGIVL